MLAIVAPGQGAQSPGMLAPWLEIACAAEVLTQAVAATGIDLVGLSASGDSAALRPTEIAQPLIVATSLAGAATLVGSAAAGISCDVVAGHSVGEWAAAAAGGYLDVTTVFRLVAARGGAMATAAAASASPTGMSAVLGGDEAVVLAALASHGLTPANVNGAGQIVAAGPVDALAALATDPPAGSRVRALDVAAAFHTATMAPAVPVLEAACASTVAGAGHAAFVGNAEGALVTAEGLVAALVAQVSLPVRFDLCLMEFARLGVTGVLELPPAGVLTALVKRQLPGVATFQLKSPQDVAAAREFVAAHAGERAGLPVPVPA